LKWIIDTMKNLSKTKHKWSEEEYKAKLKEISPNLVLLSKFIILRDYIKVQDELGIIYCSLAQTFLKSRPSIKSAIDKTDAFIRKAKTIHGDKYDYAKVVYINNLTKVIINCPNHGEFNQTPNCHLNQSQGCPQCKTIGWGSSKENWINFTEERSCIFYIINCYNEEEEFIKMGITSTSVEKRFSHRKKFPYKYTILWEVNGTGEFVWNLEQKFKDLYSEDHYIPKLEFGGKTECYNSSEVFKIMEQLKFSLNLEIKNEKV